MQENKKIMQDQQGMLAEVKSLRKQIEIYSNR